VRSEKLELRHSGHGSFEINGHADEIDARFSGQGKVRVGPLEDTKVVELRHSGHGELNMSGTCGSMHAHLSGHGEIDLGDLMCGNINLRASGMGELHLDARTISGSFSGHGSLYVKRSRASVDWNVTHSGLGQIHFAPEHPSGTTW